MLSADPLPLSENDIRRAAEEMIAAHGPAASTKAEARVRALTSEGFYSVARTWEQIHEAIGEAQARRSARSAAPDQRGDNATEDPAERYRAALNKGVLMSE